MSDDDELRDMADRLARLPVGTMSPRFRQRMQGILAEVPISSPHHHRSRWWGGAAAVLVLGGLGLSGILHGPEPRSAAAGVTAPPTSVTRPVQKGLMAPVPAPPATAENAAALPRYVAWNQRAYALNGSGPGPAPAPIGQRLGQYGARIIRAIPGTSPAQAVAVSNGKGPYIEARYAFPLQLTWQGHTYTVPNPNNDNGRRKGPRLGSTGPWTVYAVPGQDSHNQILVQFQGSAEVMAVRTAGAP